MLFCEVITGKKNIVEETESIMGARAEQSSPLLSLYSTEITCYGSWFLEYKLTQVNPFQGTHDGFSISRLTDAIVLFHNDISPSGVQPELHMLAHQL